MSVRAIAGRMATGTQVFALGVLVWAWRLRAAILSIALGALILGIFPEARDLLLDRFPPWKMAFFVALVVFLWALPLQVSVRRTLTGHGIVLGLVPRAIAVSAGLAPFLVLLLGILMTNEAITSCEDIRTAPAMEDCLKNPHEQDLYTLDDIRAGRLQPKPLQRSVQATEAIDGLSGLAGALVVSALIFLVVAVVRRNHSSAKTDGHPLQRADQPRIEIAATEIALGASAIIVVLGAFVAPFSFADVFSRLALLPLIAGSWLALLNGIAPLRRSVRWGIALGVFGLLLSSTFLSRFNDVRTYASSRWEAAQEDGADATAFRQMFLEDAVEKWMVANHCEQDVIQCPRPVLVAAEGGASRSAFFVATMLGALLDHTRANPGTYHDLSTSFFAFSGVSGGAFGLASVRTALADEGDNHAPPCKVSDNTWFADRPGEAPSPGRDFTQSWRACLQLLTAGDFLTPTVVGLVLRDNFGLLASMDRSALLAQAIERHYNRVVGSGSPECGGGEDERGFCRPFGYLASEKRWLPLLVLNATDIDTGRPILISDFQTQVAKCDQNSCPPLFRAAHNVFELTARDPRTKPEPPPDVLTAFVAGGLGKAKDLRLSTAVVLSARFPFVTSAGQLRFENEYRSIITGRVVDGGYFDNSGLETINHLLPYLHSKQLKPLVIYLRTSPWYSQRYDLAGSPILGSSQDQLWETKLSAWQGSFWDYMARLLSEPLETLNMARTGHVEAAREQLQRLKEDYGDIEIAELKVMDPLRPLPGGARQISLCIDPPAKNPFGRASLYTPVMSWWLSPLAQSALDAQPCDYDNTWMMMRILKAVELNHAG